MLRDPSGGKLTGAGELLLEGNISGASDGVIEVEGMVEDIDGVTWLAGIPAGEAAGDDTGRENTGALTGFSTRVDAGEISGEDFVAGGVDGLVFGYFGTGDDAGVITGVLNPGRGVIVDDTEVAGAGEFIGETNGVDFGTINDALGDIAGAIAGVSNSDGGVIADGTGAAIMDDGVVAGEIIGERNGVDTG